MKAIYTFVGLCLIVALSGCEQTTAPSATQNQAPGKLPSLVDDDDAEPSSDIIMLAAEEIDSGEAILIDVREQSEWDDAHFENAILIPMSKINEDVSIVENTEGVDKSKLIYTHCAKGRRASIVAETLNEQGYDVVALEVSFEELKDGGFKVAK